MLSKISSWRVGGLSDNNDVSNAVAGLNVHVPGREDIPFQSLGAVIGSSVSPVESLKDLFVLHVPSVLAFLVLCGSWSHIPMLARWSHPFAPSLSQGLPRDWLNRVKANSEPNVESNVLSSESAQGIACCLRSVGLQALDVQIDEDIACGLKLELEKSLGALSSHVHALDSFNATAVRKLARLRYSSASLLPQLLSSFDLRNKSKLQHHAAKFIEMLPEAFKPVMKAWSSSQVAPGTTLQRSEMALDVALQIFHRMSLSECNGVLKYAWGDSTSKYGLELFNSRYRWLQKSQSIALARAWKYLCTHPHDDDAAMPNVELRRCESSDLLFQNIHLHTLPPQCLGDKRTALSDKVAAYVHACLLESSSLEDLEVNFAEHVSWCSDMGVASGLASFHVTEVERVLPPWLRPARITVLPEIQVEDGVELALPPVDDEPAAAVLLPNAFRISGVCHAIHNSTKNLNDAFKGFDNFLEKLKCLYKFLGNQLRVKRFLEVVMRGTVHYDFAQKLFSKKLTSIYTERWNVLATCLKESFPLLQFLRMHWDDVRFSHDPCQATLQAMTNPSMLDGWSPHQVTEIVSDSCFVAFWRMQLHLRKHLLRFQSWAEGCSCHGPPLAQSLSMEHAEDDAGHSHQRVLCSEVKRFDGVPCICPMMGCQAPFFATDCLETFENHLKNSSCDFIAECQERLDGEQWANLLADWQHGCSVLMEQLRSRLDFYRGLPWIVFGGAHPDLNVARAALKKALELWNSLVPEAKCQQHSQVQKLFGNDDALRHELDSFVDGEAPLEDFPDLELFVSSLAFVQVAERMIEASVKRNQRIFHSHCCH